MRKEATSASLESAAFFADHVVLVEGDSDMISLPHIAATLDGTRAGRHDVMYVRVSGKGSIQRYRDFFELFNVRISVICDLDAIVNGFDKLGASAEAVEARAKLLAKLDARLPPTSALDGKREAVEDLKKGASTKALWRRAIEAQQQWRDDHSNWEALEAAMKDLFDRTIAPARYPVLRDDRDEDLLRLKHVVIDELAKNGTYVLARGCIEDYYPDTVASGEKIDRAFTFCKSCSDAAFLDSGSTSPGQLASSVELSRIFASIYGDES